VFESALIILVPEWLKSSSASAFNGGTWKAIQHGANVLYFVHGKPSTEQKSFDGRFFRPAALHSKDVRSDRIFGDSQELHLRDITAKMLLDLLLDVIFHFCAVPKRLLKIIKARQLPTSAPPKGDGGAGESAAVRPQVDKAL
jgi:hypothetical protein